MCPELGDGSVVELVDLLAEAEGRLLFLVDMVGVHAGVHKQHTVLLWPAVRLRRGREA